jgi:hypothetical protein
MKIIYIAAALLGSSSTIFGQHDALAAQGMLNLGLYVANNGYLEPKTCSLKTVRVRREWYVSLQRALWLERITLTTRSRYNIRDYNSR